MNNTKTSSGGRKITMKAKVGKYYKPLVPQGKGDNASFLTTVDNDKLHQEIRDLTLSLKMEKRDHQITKEELQNLQEKYESAQEELHANLETKINELRATYTIQIEQLRSQLDLTQIKARSLQTKYDELVLKSMDENQEREVRMAEYIEQQAAMNVQMVEMFKEELSKLTSAK